MNLEPFLFVFKGVAYLCSSVYSCLLQRFLVSHTFIAFKLFLIFYCLFLVLDLIWLSKLHFVILERLAPSKLTVEWLILIRCDTITSIFPQVTSCSYFFLHATNNNATGFFECYLEIMLDCSCKGCLR